MPSLIQNVLDLAKGAATPPVAPYAPVFYPAMSINLIIRFDEALTVDSGSLPAAQSPGDKAGQGGLSSGAAQLGAATGQATSSAKKLEPLVADIGAENLTQVFNIIPTDATIELPGYRQAGKFSLTIAWKDFPIDPRAIRAMAVEIYAATIKPEDYAAGMVQSAGGIRKSMFNPAGSSGFSKDDNLLMIGVVDEIDVELNDKQTTLVFDGRDLRGILLDSPIQTKALTKLDLKQPIDKVVQQILDLHPRQSNIATSTGKKSKYFVVAPVDPKEWPNGTVPSPAAQGDVTAVRLGAGGSNPTMSPQGEPDKLNFWDIITNYCYLVGAIPYFTARTVKVRPARSIYDLAGAGQGSKSVPAPFAGGAARTITTSDGTETFGVRRMIYGRDISKLHLSRKCGGTQTPAITVVSLDTSSDQRGKAKLLEVTYPSKETVAAGADAQTQKLGSKVSAAQSGQNKAAKVKPAKSLESAQRTAMGADGNSAEVQTVRVSIPGIRSKQKLIEIARNLYEELGRQEIGGSCATSNLASFGGDNGDPDLLRIRPGDAIQLLVDQRALSSQLPLVAPLSDLARMSFSEAVATLQARLGVSTNMARVLVATSRNVVQQFSTYFRVSNVKYAWGGNNGMKISFDFQNYIEVRNQMDQSPGQIAPW